MADHDIKQGIIVSPAVNGDRYIARPDVGVQQDYETTWTWQIKGACTVVFERRVPAAADWDPHIVYKGSDASGVTGTVTVTTFATYDQNGCNCEAACRVTSGTPDIVVNGSAK